MDPKPSKTAKFRKSGPVAILASAYGVDFEISEPAPPVNAEGVATVTIRGPLVQHCAGSWGLDSYEAILSRFNAALSTEATTIELRIHSPGGDVFGSFEAARFMRAAAASAGKNLIAYVDGMAASAGYILACSAETIYLPPAGCVGSIGVVDMIGSQARLDQAQGLDIAVITSGERKSDGNPHVPITEGALAAAQAHVDELAELFYGWVAESRGLDVDAIRGLQAACFTGASAVSAGLADAVVPFHELRPLLARGTNLEIARNDPGLGAIVTKTFKEVSAMLTSALAGGPGASKFTDAMAALAALAEDGDEDAKKAMKKMLSPAKAAEDAPPAKSEPPAAKSEPPAATQASAAHTEVDAMAMVVQLRNELAARDIAAERATLLASRPDMMADPKMNAWLTKASIETVREAVATVPKAVVPTVPKVAATRGAGQGEASGLAEDQSMALKVRMGLAPAQTSALARVGTTSVFGGTAEQIEKVRIEKGISQ
jgi:ClpP class serine protease